MKIILTALRKRPIIVAAGERRGPEMAEISGMTNQNFEDDWPRPPLDTKGQAVAHGDLVLVGAFGFQFECFIDDNSVDEPVRPATAMAQEYYNCAQWGGVAHWDTMVLVSAEYRAGLDLLHHMRPEPLRNESARLLEERRQAYICHLSDDERRREGYGLSYLRGAGLHGIYVANARHGMAVMPIIDEKPPATDAEWQYFNAGIKVDHALMKKVIATHATPEMLALSPEKFAEAVAGYDLGQSNDLYNSFVFAFRQLGRSDFDPANTASFVLNTCWWRDVKALLGITEVRRFVSEDHLNNIERVRQHHAI